MVSWPKVTADHLGHSEEPGGHPGNFSLSPSSGFAAQPTQDKDGAAPPAVHFPSSPSLWPPQTQDRKREDRKT